MTNKTQKVLIALDYDPTAQKVAEVGYSMAKAMGAEVILLHVISEPVYYATTEYSPIMGYTGFMDMNPVQLNNVEGLIKASEDFLDKIKEHLGDKTITTRVKDGNYAETILKTANELKVDIIALGTHGRKWLEKIVIGSVTEEVLNHSSIPLFIIPTKKHR